MLVVLVQLVNKVLPAVGTVDIVLPAVGTVDIVLPAEGTVDIVLPAVHTVITSEDTVLTAILHVLVLGTVHDKSINQQ